MLLKNSFFNKKDLQNKLNFLFLSSWCGCVLWHRYSWFLISQVFCNPVRAVQKEQNGQAEGMSEPVFTGISIIHQCGSIGIPRWHWTCVGRLVLQLEMMRRSVESYWKTALYLSLNCVLPLSVAQTVVFAAVCCSFRRSSANQWTSCTTIKGYASLLTSQVACAVTSVSGIIAASFAVLSPSPSSISLPSFVSIMGHPLCVLCCSSSSLPTPQLWEC